MMVEQVLGMGGYGAYVWPAYGMTVVALLWLLLASIRACKRNEALLKQARETR
jgi:heme exporter protein D